MPVTFNIRHLEKKTLRLTGELPAADLDIDTRDEIIHLSRPVGYDLRVEGLQGGILVQGRLRVILDCECVRCLKSFARALPLDEWTCHLPLEGEEKVTVVGDCVDLTPYLREDILLAFPQHPLCEPDCKGLAAPDRTPEAGGARGSGLTSSAWAVLNKLKL